MTPHLDPTPLDGPPLPSASRRDAPSRNGVVTRRAKAARVIQSFGGVTAPDVLATINQLIRREGLALFDDAAVELIAKRLIGEHVFLRRLAIRNHVNNPPSREMIAATVRKLGGR